MLRQKVDLFRKQFFFKTDIFEFQILFVILELKHSFGYFARFDRQQLGYGSYGILEACKSLKRSHPADYSHTSSAAEMLSGKDFEKTDLT